MCFYEFIWYVITHLIRQCSVESEVLQDMRWSGSVTFEITRSIFAYPEIAGALETRRRRYRGGEEEAAAAAATAAAAEEEEDEEEVVEVEEEAYTAKPVRGWVNKKREGANAAVRRSLVVRGESLLYC